MNISRVKKDTLVATIEKSGCDMLKDKLDGSETKDEIVHYLKKCECKVLKEKFSGIE